MPIRNSNDTRYGNSRKTSCIDPQIGATVGGVRYPEKQAGRFVKRKVSIPQVPPPKRHPYDQWSPDARALDLVGDKWTLLIVRDLAAGPRRFVELQRVLPGISTEQLRSRLNRMVADGMLTRKRYREVPPRVDYELTQRARELMPILGALARWGFDWAWSPPRASERISLGAIFRLAPGLVHPPADVSGVVELTVQNGEAGEPLSYAVSISGGDVTLEERTAENPAARVSGPPPAWISAFSPGGGREGLEITGDEKLAGALLDGLALGGARTAEAAGDGEHGADSGAAA
ncbi:MAG: helix-turn-helix transcriptional regulator [Solirubrobacterales bacterium]|nr:helix-turn-helix transcriptional regulator [Solirubrobacterales bacterium]